MGSHQIEDAKLRAFVQLHEKTPKPLAKYVKDMIVIAAVIMTTPIACFSCIDIAPLHVAHLKSFSGVYGCLLSVSRRRDVNRTQLTLYTCQTCTVRRHPGSQLVGQL
jgi:hypothetical protein